MRKHGIFIAIIVIFLISSVVHAIDDRSLEGWSDITTIYNFAERWQYNGDQGIRVGLSGDDFSLFYFRPSIKYRINPKLTLHGGIGFFQSFLQDNIDVSELRPWQGLRYQWPQLGGYTFNHYVRLEQRMVWASGKEGNPESTLRSRYMFGVSTPIYNVLLENGIFLTGSAEFFWDMQDSFAENFKNRIRWDVGIGSIFFGGMRVELHYILQDGRTLQQDSFTGEEHIIRLRFFYIFG